MHLVRQGPPCPWETTLSDLLRRYHRLTKTGHIRPSSTPSTLRCHSRWMNLLLLVSNPARRENEWCRPAMLRVPAARVPTPLSFRRHAFSVAEVNALYRVAKPHALDWLLLCVLFTSAIRVGGFCRLPLPDPEQPLDGQTLINRSIGFFQKKKKKGDRSRPGEGRQALSGVLLSVCGSSHTAVVGRAGAPGGRRVVLPDTSHAAWACTVPHRCIHVVHPVSIQSVVPPGGYSWRSRPHSHHKQGFCCLRILTTRHTVAVAMRMAGYSILDIQSYLHHANPITTMTVYCAPEFEQLLSVLRLPWSSPRNDDSSTQQRRALLEALVPPTHCCP